MKKVMSVLALCGLLALSGGSAFAAQWKLAHIRPADSVIERDLQAFATIRKSPFAVSDERAFCVAITWRTPSSAFRG